MIDSLRDATIRSFKGVEMLKKGLLGAAVALAAVSAQSQTVLLSESFDDITSLAAKGWVQTNASSPLGAGAWFQGNSGVFAAQSGAVSSYIASNFNAGVDGGTVANWLISPTFSTASAGSVSFWAKADIFAPYFDQIAVGFSTGSSSTSAFTLGSAVTVGGAWTQYTYGFAAQGAGSVARFAIEYVGLDSDANYVGIDTLMVSAISPVVAVPEPSSFLLLGLGLGGLAVVGRRHTARSASLV